MDALKQLAKPALAAQHDPAANTAAVVTIAAPGAQQCIYITGVVFSASAAPTAAVAATIVGTGTTLTKRIAAAAFAPIALFFGTHPIRCAPGTQAVVTLPALGAGVLGSVTVYYYIGEA
jgi:hypothetical protein